MVPHRVRAREAVKLPQQEVGRRLVCTGGRLLVGCEPGLDQALGPAPARAARACIAGAAAEVFEVLAAAPCTMPVQGEPGG